MKCSPPTLLSLLAICLFLPLPLACAGSGNGNHYGRHVSVAVSPIAATVQVSQSQQFTANISGTPNTAVNWLVNGTLGGDSSVGTISASGQYTAPSTVPAGSITVTAQSAAEATASGNASVSVVPPPTVTVTISPTSPTVQVSQTTQFTATVSGSTNTAVNWLVNGVAGGNLIVGTISSSGLYTAPSSVPSGSVIVTAQSASNPASSADAAVTVSAPVVHQVGLSWSASSSSVAGYNVYRSTQLSGSYTRINSSLDTATLYNDSVVQFGQTYYYAVTAVDSNGVESSYSNVVQAAIP